MNDRRHALLGHVDQRIEISGMFERFSFVTYNLRDIRTALLQDVYAHVDGKNLDIGHIWLQHADPLKHCNLTYGDRIHCECRVTEYKKRLRVPNSDGLLSVTSVSLSWPTDVEVLSRLQRNVEDHDAGPAALIGEVRGLASRVGGYEELCKLIEVLRTSS